MPDSKLFEARSVMTFTPRREHHNATFKCEAWNEAANNLRPALARLFVQYAPSVTVTQTRPGMVQEGDKVMYIGVEFFLKSHSIYPSIRPYGLTNCFLKAFKLSLKNLSAGKNSNATS